MDTSETRRPLFITDDRHTEAALRKLATAAGTEAWCVATAREARRYWGAAGVVVIAADTVRDCVDSHLPHRGNVILLTGEGFPYDQAWPLALTMGADQVASLPAAGAWLASRLTPLGPRPTTATTVTIIGARGGVGASILAASLAHTAADSGRATLLVDGDPHGGGLDLVLGWENRDGLRWPDLLTMSGPFDPNRLRSCLPQRNGLSLLSFSRNRPVHPDSTMPTSDSEPPHVSVARGPSKVTSILDTLARCHDLVILDAPRNSEPWLTDAVAGSDLLAIVVPGEVRAVAATRQIIAAYAGQCDRVRVIVRSPSPSRLSISDIVEATGVPLVAELRTDSRITTATEAGALVPRAKHGTLAAAAGELLACLDHADTANPSLSGSRR